MEADTTTRRRVVVADDDVLLREGLASLLDRSDFEVVGQAGNANELVELVREHRPDLAIVDIRMPPTHSAEGLEAAQAYRGASLDEMLSTDESGGTLGDLLGAADAELERVDYRQSLEPLLSELPERERTILMLRFFGNMTQTQIADRVGVSQMHVSRLLGQTLARLRERLEDDQ